MTDLIAEAGFSGARASDIARGLSLDKTLAWKITRFTESSDPCAAFKHFPGPGGVEIVVSAALERGVPSVRADAVKQADGALRDFVRQHAGDRRTFEAMLAGISEGGDAFAPPEAFKAYYQSASAIWGVRARSQFLTLMLRPSFSKPDRIDVVQVSGFVELERLRPDVPWIIRRMRVLSDAGGRRSDSFVREPLDPSGSTGAALGLMPGYCSSPLPRIEQFEGDDGWVYDELASGEVGRAGAKTIVAGEKYHAPLPLHRDENNSEGRYKLTLRTPVEAVQMDLLLSPELAHFAAPRVRLLGLIEDRPAGAEKSVAPHELVPSFESDGLGSPPILQTTRVPRYAELVTDAFRRAGWDGFEHYRAYRAELEHPPVPSDLTLVCELR